MRRYRSHLVFLLAMALLFLSGASSGADPLTGAELCAELGGRIDFNNRTCTLEGRTCSIPEPEGGSCMDLKICTVNEDCASDEYCAASGCEGPGICRPRPEFCTMDYRPVCGCDGRTYSNSCSAAQKGVRIAYPGKCLPQEIALDLEVSGNRVKVSWKTGKKLVSTVLFYAPWPEMRPISSIALSPNQNSFSVDLPPGSAYYVAVGGLTEEGEFVISNIESVRTQQSCVVLFEPDSGEL